MNKEKLESCPHCNYDGMGEEEIEVVEIDLTQGFYQVGVRCYDCETTSAIKSTRKEAIKTWNARPKEQALQKEVTRANLAIERLYLENNRLYEALSPLLGLRVFHGTCNDEQVIWARSQEQANSLTAGQSVYTFTKQALAMALAMAPAKRTRGIDYEINT